jgi:DNA-binding transcriptional ArsR family regulator
MQSTNDRLSSTFSALADPTRRAILARLAAGEASVSELAKPMKMTMPAVTKHLKVLQKAGLIRQERRAQFRPCYLVAAPLEQAANWVEQYRKFWEESFNRLDDYLKVLQAQNVSETVNKKPTRKKKDE